MARPRTPKAKAAVTGRDQHDSKRFKNRKEPVVNDDIGKPPAWLKDTDKKKALTAWKTLVKEIPWLNSSHRSLVAMASDVFGRMIAGDEVGVQAMNFFRQCLGQMGATPADASKITVQNDEDEEEDDLDD